jgi:hypothetical protein
MWLAFIFVLAVLVLGFINGGWLVSLSGSVWIVVTS